jgi:hypothetical protein
VNVVRGGTPADDGVVRIPWFVLPCAIGFLVLGVLVGAPLADLMGVSRGTFLLRFAPLFAWGGTFALALYLGRHPRTRPSPPPQESEAFLAWGGTAQGRSTR